MSEPDTGDVLTVGVERFVRNRLVTAPTYSTDVLDIMRLISTRISDIVDDPAMPDHNKVAVMRDLAAKIKIVGEGE